MSNYPSNNNKAHIPALPMPLLQNFHKAHLYKCQDFYLHASQFVIHRPDLPPIIRYPKYILYICFHPHFLLMAIPEIANIHIH